jgi:hypothetical protein
MIYLDPLPNLPPRGQELFELPLGENERGQKLKM